MKFMQVWSFLRGFCSTLESFDTQVNLKNDESWTFKISRTLKIRYLLSPNLLILHFDVTCHGDELKAKPKKWYIDLIVSSCGA